MGFIYFGGLPIASHVRLVVGNVATGPGGLLDGNGLTDAGGKTAHVRRLPSSSLIATAPPEEERVGRPISESNYRRHTIYHTVVEPSRTLQHGRWYLGRECEVGVVDVGDESKE